MSDGVSIPDAIRIALAHHQAGRLDQAGAIYEEILRAVPDHPDALHMAGVLAHQRGNHRQAVELIGKAVAGHASGPAYTNLGTALAALGRDEEAVAAFRSALGLEPGNVKALAGLGKLLRTLGRPAEAMPVYGQWLQLKPDSVDAHAQCGLTLQALGDRVAAVAHYRRALVLKPDYAEVHNNLGMALKDLGQLDEALNHFRTCLALQPDLLEAHSNLLLVLSGHPACTAAEYLSEARVYGAKAVARARPRTSWQVDPEAGAAGILRVGFVSGDLRSHPVGYFLETIVAHLRALNIEPVAYSTNTQEDALTARLKPHFAAWHVLAGLTNEQAAEKIHADGIHVLVDLAGHTAHNRLPLFAWKPAPVQVSWLGYFASTGVPGIDYLLTDRVSAPESGRDAFSEEPWYLPETRLCFSPPASSPETGPLPALQNGYPTLGSFQGLLKINDGVLALWAKVLHALPAARFRLQNREMSSAGLRAELLQRFAALGIAGERLQLVEPVSRHEYLAACNRIDFILDTFPYPGGATTCEALWMGVPTLTLAGDTLLARQGASLMSSAGLADWIATDAEDYVARAVRRASDPDRLAMLRCTLRGQVSASPLMDSQRFAGHLAQALRGMARREQQSSDNGCAS